MIFFERYARLSPPATGFLYAVHTGAIVVIYFLPTVFVIDWIYQRHQSIDKYASYAFLTFLPTATIFFPIGVAQSLARTTPLIQSSVHIALASALTMCAATGIGVLFGHPTDWIGLASISFLAAIMLWLVALLAYRSASKQHRD